MGRTMPTECPHGYVYDWGDFGCQEEDCYGTCDLIPAQHFPEGCNDPKSTPAPCRCALISERLTSRAAAFEQDAAALRAQLADLETGSSPGIRATKTAAKEKALAVAHELRDCLRDLGLDGQDTAA